MLIPLILISAILFDALSSAVVLFAILKCAHFLFCYRSLRNEGNNQMKPFLSTTFSNHEMLMYDFCTHEMLMYDFCTQALFLLNFVIENIFAFLVDFLVFVNV